MLASEYSKEWTVGDFDAMAHQVGLAMKGEHILRKLSEKNAIATGKYLGTIKSKSKVVLIWEYFSS